MPDELFTRSLFTQVLTMVPGLYSAASSMRADERNHEIIAMNLAHAGLPGYRRQVTAVETFGQVLQASSRGLERTATGLQANLIQTDFSPGELQHTGRPLDLALRGDGFFVLDGPKGPIYTRNGVFQLNGNGELQSMAGLPVRGSAGRITIPPDATEIVVHPDGAIVAGTGEVGRLELAHFKNPRELIRVGESLFQAPAGVRSQPGNTSVQQSYREMSNVSVVDEMVQMIVGMRHYEASQRALRTIAESIQLNTRPQTG
jgi:flagellar basal body rod protein FlgG